MARINPLEAYRQAGVDLDASNVASQIAANVCQETWEYRHGLFGTPSAFSGEFISTKRLVTDEIRQRPDVSMVCGVDGTGTKPEIAELMQMFHTLGRDLVAMAIDDNPVEGGEAVLLNNGLAVSRLDEETLPYIQQLFEGLREGCHQGGVVAFTGEIAVHGDRLQGPTDFTVDWMADAIGLVSEQRLITGEKVTENDILVGFAEPVGFRCNGISMARKVFQREYKENWHLTPRGNTTIGELALTPSTIYSGYMRELTGGYRTEKEKLVDVHGVAHISGGSIPEKVGRMLRASRLGAMIDDPFELPDIMKHCQEVAKIKDGDTYRPMSDEEMITTWHGGQGYILALPEADVQTVLDVVPGSKPIGRVTKEPGITVLSRGFQTPGKLMKFNQAA